jgi:hypothetical protein
MEVPIGIFHLKGESGRRWRLWSLFSNYGLEAISGEVVNYF